MVIFLTIGHDTPRTIKQGCESTYQQQKIRTQHFYSANQGKPLKTDLRTDKRGEAKKGLDRIFVRHKVGKKYPVG
jgi:hypothetical protein